MKEVIQKHTHLYEKQAIANKYNWFKAEKYFHKFDVNWFRRLANRIEQRMALKSLKLAGNPKQILDLPCGAGRFWQTLANSGEHIELLAADYSNAMISTGLKYDKSTPIQVAFNASIYSIPMPDNAVEHIFCMRYFHHVGHSEERQKILRELYRVTQKTVSFSTYVDKGGLIAKIWKNKRRHRDGSQIYNEYITSPADIEADCKQAGFEIVGHLDMFKGLSLWRTYVLAKNERVKDINHAPFTVDQLGCPVCKNHLEKSGDQSELICRQDKLAFPIENDLPVLVVQKARSID